MKGLVLFILLSLLLLSPLSYYCLLLLSFSNCWGRPGRTGPKCGRLAVHKCPRRLQLCLEIVRGPSADRQKRRASWEAQPQALPGVPSQLLVNGNVNVKGPMGILRVPISYVEKSYTLFLLRPFSFEAGSRSRASAFGFWFGRYSYNFGPLLSSSTGSCFSVCIFWFACLLELLPCGSGTLSEAGWSLPPVGLKIVNPRPIIDL